MSLDPPKPAADRSLTGALFAVSAHVWWGAVTPLYIRVLGPMPAVEVIAHRIAWSLAFTLAILAFIPGGIVAYRRMMSGRSTLVVWLAVAALLVAGNWATFVYAVQAGNLLAASLGYFVTPLVQVGLGMLVMREQLRPLQKAAVALGMIAVALMFVQVESGTWIAVALAGTWGIYSLIRRRLNVDAIPALAVECTALLPAGLAVIAWSLTDARSGARTASTTALLLLPLAGLITAIPLLMFGAAARRLPMRALGFTQYIGPTLQFAMAVLLFHERVSGLRLASFAIIWAALALYTFDAVRRLRSAPAEKRDDDSTSELVARAIADDR